jgi:hypothetical protein
MMGALSLVNDRSKEGLFTQDLKATSGNTQSRYQTDQMATCNSAQSAPS